MSVTPLVTIDGAIAGGDDRYMFTVTDRTTKPTLYAVCGIDGKLLHSLKNNPVRLLNLIVDELNGAMRSIELRRKNIPSAGAFATQKGSGKVSRITFLNRNTGTVCLDDGPEIPWSDCEYV